VWSCVLRAGSLARLAPTGLEQLVALPVPNPSDLAFAGPRRDRLYLTSIAADLGDGAPPDSARSLMVLDGLGVEGMPERRFELG
jgi:sugar lactone lactonase YvrE